MAAIDTITWSTRQIADDLSTGVVSSWADHYGLGAAMTQATSADRPTCVASVINGHNAVQFASSQWVFTNSYNNDVSDVFSRYIIFKATTLGGGFRSLLGGNRAFSNLGVGWNSGGSLYVLNFVGSSSPATSTIAADTTKWHNVMLTNDGTTTNVYLDGTIMMTDTSGLSGSDAGLAIGSDYNGTSGFDGMAGFVAEHGRMPAVATTAQRAIIDTYAQVNYGVVVSDFISAPRPPILNRAALIRASTR